MQHEAILPLQLKELKLATITKHWKAMEEKARDNQWNYSAYLSHLCAMELEHRQASRLQRRIKESRLPKGKTLSSFQSKDSSVKVEQVNALAQTDSWIQNANNLIIFGPSGVGKTHIACAIAYRQIELGARVKFYMTSHLVQELQLAKTQFRLQHELNKLDKISVLILDDIGYIKKNEAETSVLFELICHRYETGSLIITANQPFSEWDKIFPDNMMAVAAIDRLIHHATVINIEGESYRMKEK